MRCPAILLRGLPQITVRPSQFVSPGCRLNERRIKQPCQARLHTRAMTADVEDVPFCIPAEGLFHPGCRWRNGVCYDGDCEALHISAADREEQLCWDQPSTPQLIITAGPERSGSTWLFNAVRLLFKSAKQPLDSYWLTQVTDEKLADRHGGQPGGHHVLIKTHRWSNAWTPSQADHVFLTHRDLRGVVASYQRMGWAYDIPDTYVSEHQAWKGIANRDLAYEDIMSDPEGQLRALATDLGLVEQVNLPDVLQQLRDLNSDSQ
ncbi:hypothetical protein WJX72_005211 [[Myrmecia] bisecta]|uniref:Sulfotransferase domain-containing protein n=1 Tax=[Myrmecia] bisecta TaxID=41462 RepID=A0AAW1PLK1_9CHLO